MIEFDEATHTYRVGGQVVPGVTSILRPLVDWSMVNPDILEAKSDLGRRVHKATDLDDGDELDEASIGSDVAPYLAGWRKFKADVSPVIILSEHEVYNKASHYCGKLDRVLGIDGEDWLIDIKSSAQIHHAVGPQTAAYEKPLGLAKPLRRGVVQLRPDGTYRFRELSNPKDWVVFQACNLIYRTNQESHHV